MDIRILPSNIANTIAAGEVVQRPASVVKELMENAVDAGANSITVIIQDAGRTLIQVIDNGCGMSPDQAVLCFERHATSKIASVEDLNNLETFGFRGEALASIAAVAEVSLKTRREEDEVGCEVLFADSQHMATEEISTPVGANFSVRNLFYNVPARRKFMRSDNAEFRHITTEFIHVALTRPDVAFTLTHNGRDVFCLSKANSLKYRIQDLLGSSAAEKVVDIETNTTVVKLSGFVGRPDSAKKALGNQYFFVNGRYFKSPYFNKAILKAYDNLVPEGYTPSYFIYMEVDPHQIDVNIHPTKTEIKFQEDSVIFQTLYASVKEALGRNSFGASIDFERENAPELPVLSQKFQEQYQPVEPTISSDPSFNPFENDGFPSEPTAFNNVVGTYGGPENFGNGDYGTRGQRRYESYGHVPASQFINNKNDCGKLFDDKILATRLPVVMHNKYILTVMRTGLRVINIRRAKEKVLYERFIKALAKNEHVTQNSLFPVQMQIGVEQTLLFQEHQEFLYSLGFDISPLGNDTVVVNGVPEGYSVEPGKVQTLLYDLMSVLSEDHSSLKTSMMASMAEKFAKIGSMSDDSEMSPQMAQDLVEKLFSCENAEYTSSGKKVMVLIPTTEIDRKF